MSLIGVLNQIFQPYFYYSIIILVLTFVCIKLFTRLCPLPPKTQSLLYLIPLAAPLLIMAVYIPSTIIQSGFLRIATGTAPIAAAGSALITTSPFTVAGPLNMITLSPASFVTLPASISVTGVLCILGLVAAAVFGLSAVLANDRVARRLLHVILLQPDEHPWLQTKVAELSQKMAIPSPNIGVVEDLRPNAFTIGYGDNATIVFSMGLLNLLSPDEVAAVASHELAHIKNGDFFYKTLSSTLTVTSFFNPLSYIASSAAQRERETFADQNAAGILDNPSMLGDALAKICKALETLPRASLKATFSSNLLVTSSVLHRVGILSTHPRLDKRLRNISKPPHAGTRLSPCRVGVTVFCLTALLICSLFAASYVFAAFQPFVSVRQISLSDAGAVGFSVDGGFVLSDSPVAVQAVGRGANFTEVELAPVTAGSGVLAAGNGSSLAGAVAVEGSVFSVGNLSVFP
jgi:heat shock protein HtpX